MPLPGVTSLPATPGAAEGAGHEHHPEHPGTERPSASAGHASVRARHRLIRRGDRPASPAGRRTALSAGSAVNPDVLHAMIILAAEIPAACAAAREVTGQPWQHHPSATCLRAIPRLHHRLTALGIPAAASDLETGMHHWTRLVKLALGLRTPDIPAGPD